MANTEKAGPSGGKGGSGKGSGAEKMAKGANGAAMGANMAAGALNSVASSQGDNAAGDMANVGAKVANGAAAAAKTAAAAASGNIAGVIKNVIMNLPDLLYFAAIAIVAIIMSAAVLLLCVFSIFVETPTQRQRRMERNYREVAARYYGRDANGTATGPFSIAEDSAKEGIRSALMRTLGEGDIEETLYSGYGNYQSFADFDKSNVDSFRYNADNAGRVSVLVGKVNGVYCNESDSFPKYQTYSDRTKNKFFSFSVERQNNLYVNYDRRTYTCDAMEGDNGNVTREKQANNENLLPSEQNYAGVFLSFTPTSLQSIYQLRQQRLEEQSSQTKVIERANSYVASAKKLVDTATAVRDTMKRAVSSAGETYSNSAFYDYKLLEALSTCFSTIETAANDLIALSMKWDVTKREAVYNAAVTGYEQIADYRLEVAAIEKEARQYLADSPVSASLYGEGQTQMSVASSIDGLAAGLTKDRQSSGGQYSEEALIDFYLGYIEAERKKFPVEESDRRELAKSMVLSQEGEKVEEDDESIVGGNGYTSRIEALAENGAKECLSNSGFKSENLFDSYVISDTSGEQGEASSQTGDSSFDGDCFKFLCQNATFLLHNAEPSRRVPGYILYSRNTGYKTGEMTGTATAVQSYLGQSMGGEAPWSVAYGLNNADISKATFRAHLNKINVDLQVASVQDLVNLFNGNKAGVKAENGVLLKGDNNKILSGGFCITGDEIQALLLQGNQSNAFLTDSGFSTSDFLWQPNNHVFYDVFAQYGLTEYQWPMVGVTSGTNNYSTTGWFDEDFAAGGDGSFSAKGLRESFVSCYDTNWAINSDFLERTHPWQVIKSSEAVKLRSVSSNDQENNLRVVALGHLSLGNGGHDPSPSADTVEVINIGQGGEGTGQFSLQDDSGCWGALASYLSVKEGYPVAAKDKYFMVIRERVFNKAVYDEITSKKEQKINEWHETNKSTGVDLELTKEIQQELEYQAEEEYVLEECEGKSSTEIISQVYPSLYASIRLYFYFGVEFDGYASDWIWEDNGKNFMPVSDYAIAKGTAANTAYSMTGTTDAGPETRYCSMYLRPDAEIGKIDNGEHNYLGLMCMEVSAPKYFTYIASDSAHLTTIQTDQISNVGGTENFPTDSRTMSEQEIFLRNLFISRASIERSYYVKPDEYHEKSFTSIKSYYDGNEEYEGGPVQTYTDILSTETAITSNNIASFANIMYKMYLREAYFQVVGKDRFSSPDLEGWRNIALVPSYNYSDGDNGPTWLQLSAAERVIYRCWLDFFCYCSQTGQGTRKSLFLTKISQYITPPTPQRETAVYPSGLAWPYNYKDSPKQGHAGTGGITGDFSSILGSSLTNDGMSVVAQAETSYLSDIVAPCSGNIIYYKRIAAANGYTDAKYIMIIEKDNGTRVMLRYNGVATGILQDSHIEGLCISIDDPSSYLPISVGQLIAYTPNPARSLPTTVVISVYTLMQKAEFDELVQTHEAVDSTHYFVPNDSGVLDSGDMPFYILPSDASPLNDQGECGRKHNMYYSQASAVSFYTEASDNIYGITCPPLS